LKALSDSTMEIAKKTLKEAYASLYDQLVVVTKSTEAESSEAKDAPKDEKKAGKPPKEAIYVAVDLFFKFTSDKVKQAIENNPPPLGDYVPDHLKKPLKKISFDVVSKKAFPKLDTELEKVKKDVKEKAVEDEQFCEVHER